MKKVIFIWFLVVWLGLFSPRIVFAQFGDLWGIFKEVLNNEKTTKTNQKLEDEILKPLAKDIGGIFGGGSFHTAKTCGFPGFDIGGHLPIISKLSEENKIMAEKWKDKPYGIPWIQGEVGLPFSLDLILRGFYLGKDGGTLFGTGIKYVLLSGDVPLTPALSFTLLLNRLAHDYLTVDNLSLNGIISIGLPVFTPYLGLGIDNTTVESRVVVEGLKATASGLRFIGGINFKLVPSTYFHLGLGTFNGILGYELGVGMSL